MTDRPIYDPGFPMPDMPVDPEASLSAKAGSRLPEGTAPASRDAIVEALKTVYDPEIPVDIYELGLIYEFDLSDSGQVRILMTLTTPGCPVAGEMPGMVAEAVAALDGAGEVEVELTWDPPWTPDKMSEDARMLLGMF
jgi:FeS assembly SUF system protein